MRLLDQLLNRRDVGYYEGMASGASVLFEYSTETNKETIRKDLWTFARQAAATSGVVFSCMEARAELFSQMVFQFKNLTTDNVYGTPDLRILEYPWPNGRTPDLLFRAIQDVDMGGNAYIWKAAPDLLVRLPPKDVTIVSQIVRDGMGRSYRKVLGYDYQPAPPTESGYVPGNPDIPPEHFTIDEVAHWAPICDPDATFRGMSWLTPIVKEVNADTGLTLYKTKYLEHGTPVTAVRYAQKIRPETVDSILERLRRKYGGVGNAWTPLVLDQGADPILGKGLADLDLRNVQQGSAERICAAAGVPPEIIGMKSAETGESYQTAMRRFADVTVRYLWASCCNSFAKLVDNIPSQGVDLWYDTSNIAALQAAETERAQVLQVSAAAILTLIQAGFTRESVVPAIEAGDLSLLKPDPYAPTPGTQAREAIAVTSLTPLTEDDEGAEIKSVQSNAARPQVTGNPPGGGQVLTQPQTPASKQPMPASQKTPLNGNVAPSRPGK